MKDWNWLADLASDCYDFGEKHGEERVKFRASEIVAAIERDFGLNFELLPRRSNLVEISDNVIRFPPRPLKEANNAP